MRHRPNSRRTSHRALKTILKRFRDAMQNIAIVVEDAPDPALLEEMGAGPDDTLFGLYGDSPPERQWIGETTRPIASSLQARTNREPRMTTT